MATTTTSIPDPKKVGMVSLGCPKALVDSERILTRLRADGYAMSADYAGADIVLVNTCGFLDSAKEESLQAIGEAIAENGRVIVTGCMGEEADAIRAAHPQVLAVTGAHQYEQVVDAVHTHAPPSQGPPPRQRGPHDGEWTEAASAVGGSRGGLAARRMTNGPGAEAATGVSELHWLQGLLVQFP